MLSYLKLQYIRWQTLTAYHGGDWKTLPITFEYDPLVLVPAAMARPFYYNEMGLGQPEIYLRGSVLNRLYLAQASLKKQGYKLVVYDGWRSLGVQKDLFFLYMKEFIAPALEMAGYFVDCDTVDSIEERFHSGIISIGKRDALCLATRPYVSLPSRSEQSPSPHATGGAVDVWLYDLASGEPLDMGVPFDWMEETAGAFYHLKRQRERFTDDVGVCQRRTALILAMVQAGFSCYGPEFWHFNYGNQMHALVTGKEAIFSYIEPPAISHR